MNKKLILTTLLVSSIVFADDVIVSSKIDTEGALLGNIIYQVLQAHGVKVKDKIQLGPTNIVREAILNAEIDIYPEYTGNGAFFTESSDDPVWNDLRQGYERIKVQDFEQHQLVWLEPAPANNTWGIAVSDNLYQQGITDYASLAKAFSSEEDQFIKEHFKLAASAEFIDNPMALPAFEQVYNFTLTDENLLVLSGGNTAATIQAAAMGTNGVNAAMVYGTDGAISAAHLHVLFDDKGVQSVYAPSVVVRNEVLMQYPELPEWFEPVFSKLDLETLQHLNREILLEGKSAKEVAQEFLKGILE